MNELITLLSIKEDELFELKCRIADMYHRDTGGVQNPELFKYTFQLEDEILKLKQRLAKGE